MGVDKKRFVMGIFNPAAKEEDVELLGPKLTHTVDDNLEDVESVVGPQHYQELNDLRKAFDDAAPMSSISPRKTPGMTQGETLRFAGSLPIELWMADKCLRPHLSEEERARDLLKRFPAYRVGNI